MLGIVDAGGRKCYIIVKQSDLVGIEVKRVKLSTKGRYGLKAMVDLAVAQEEDKQLTVSALAKMQGISDAYLEQLVSSLKKAELISATRGAQGGYRLSRDASDISVEEVLKALEGTTALIDCVTAETVNCENACTCSARPLWLKLQSKINDVLSETSIKDLADDYIFQQRRTING